MFNEIKKKSVRYTLVFFYLLIIFFCVLELNFLWMFGYSPNSKDIRSPNIAIASELYTVDGKLISRYYTENRTPVEFGKISPFVINALVATEDVRFYKHIGVDVISLVSSTISTANGDKRGASTITQQLAKNLYSTRNNRSQGLIRYVPGLRTIIYKLKEWVTAYKLESHYDKNEILTLYLNTVPFGNSTFGIKTAAKRYFNKTPDMLQVDEAALLVGMLKATSTYNPIRNPEKSIERRNIVLSQMHKYNFITEDEYRKYLSRPLKLSVSEIITDSQGDSYLRSAVARYLEKWCLENGYDLYEDGLKIYTTIDSKLQLYAQSAVSSQMKTLQKRFENAWGAEDPWQDLDGNPIPDFEMSRAKRLPLFANLTKKYKASPDSINYYLNLKKKMRIFSWEGDKDVVYSTLDSIAYYSKILNAGMMSFDPFTGHIKTWVGGIDFNHFKYDHVNQAKRQAGSTFKPFAYLAALQSGLNPCDKFIDQAVSIPYEENGKKQVWEPKNSNYVFTGREMSLRWAMAKSVNSITAQVTQQVGPENVVKYAHAVGIESELEAVPSVGLGSFDVSVFEMVRAYGTFLNKGVKTEPILVHQITDRDGNVIEKFKAEQKRAISEEIAWLMLYMFRGGMEEPEGTSQALWSWWPEISTNGNQIGGKTGTSTQYVDGWYMGITKDLVTGVWVGCDERTAHFRTSETGEGSRTALPIFGKFMQKVYGDPTTGYTYGRFPKPGVDITRDYDCTTAWSKRDTTDADSLQFDSLKLLDLPQSSLDSNISQIKIDVQEPVNESPRATDPRQVIPKTEPPKSAREQRQDARRERKSND